MLARASSWPSLCRWCSKTITTEGSNALTTSYKSQAVYVTITKTNRAFSSFVTYNKQASISRPSSSSNYFLRNKQESLPFTSTVLNHVGRQKYAVISTKLSHTSHSRSACLSHSCQFSTDSTKIDNATTKDKQIANNDHTIDLGPCVLDNDPELKSILEDIKKDFASEKTKESPSRDVEDSQTNADHEGQTKASDIEEFEYEYKLAEDIEEYDYIDESEIGQHQTQSEKILPISLQRGQTGVFDLDELLTLLDHLGALDVSSFPVPASARFCDHMIVVSARSRRHLQAICEEIVWVHKRKKSEADPFLAVEGLNKSDWCAMDIGNIVLHVFYGDMRDYYDIESLWTLGPDHDPKCLQPDQDPYALSAEDLFWLEATKTTEETTAQPDISETVIPQPQTLEPDVSDSNRHHLDQAVSSGRRVTDTEAGWGDK